MSPAYPDMRFGVILVALTLASCAQAQNSDDHQGQSIAYEACSACHQVIPEQQRPAAVHDPDSGDDVLAPTFAEIAQKYGPDAAGLRGAITHPVHPMREQLWNESDLNAVILYLQSLSSKESSK